MYKSRKRRLEDAVALCDGIQSLSTSIAAACVIGMFLNSPTARYGEAMAYIGFFISLGCMIGSIKVRGIILDKKEEP
ncbi:hypothetical protein LMG33810_001994 [Carnimonas sp. LMG 33810]